MDKLDEAIIAILRLNARESVASLARQLKTSRSTIQDRLKRLEQNGTIKGYSVQLDDRSGTKQVRAFVLVSVEPQRTSIIISELKTISSVNVVHTISGKYDLHIEIATSDTDLMDQAIDRVSEIPGVLRTETSIALSKRIQR